MSLSYKVHALYIKLFLVVFFGLGYLQEGRAIFNPDTWLSLEWHRALVAFVAMGFVDVFFALYTRRTAQGAAIHAGYLALFILVFGSAVVVQYVEEFRYLFFAAIGSGLSTYATVKYDSKKKP